MNKLGIYFETNYYYDRSTKALYCQDVYTNLFDQIDTDQFELHILGKSVEVLNERYYKYSIPVKFYQISFYGTLVSFYFRSITYFYKNKKILNEFVQECDSFLIMTPSPVAIKILFLIKKEKKDYTILVRQNSYEFIPNRFKGLKKVMAKVMTFFLESKVEKYCKKNKSNVIVLGDEIYKRYLKYSKNTIQFTSSKYKNKDIVCPELIKPIDWNGEIKLLFVGNLEVNKGLQELLVALNDLKNYNLKLDLVGDGAMLENIQKLISAFDLKDVVTISGYIQFGPELLEKYKKNDILILPSYSEGLPQVILEGMAKGCLILATRVGGIPSIVEHGRTGFLFEPYSSEEIKRTLIYLIDKKVVTKQICMNALETAKKYSFDNQFNILLDQLQARK